MALVTGILLYIAVFMIAATALSELGVDGSNQAEVSKVNASIPLHQLSAKQNIADVRFCDDEFLDDDWDDFFEDTREACRYCTRLRRCLPVISERCQQVQPDCSGDQRPLPLEDCRDDFFDDDWDDFFEETDEACEYCSGLRSCYAFIRTRCGQLNPRCPGPPLPPTAPGSP